ncbi:MAG: hypothetical protein UW04_C0031G0006 [Parcubacteria group bacterium GW2011_GWB1_43_8]|nr:MAG: hypothetical protein UW04_C0031G0006 [Parcubacteria group bacterium GW2011_GWB1_43_8]KKU06867.1 MAG: hypothetical protein UX11_C0025G0006 [Candidatus Collierbacteria bacterium GW2011_GWC2_45_40]
MPLKTISDNYKLKQNNNMDKKIKNHLGIGALVSMVILATSSLIFANIYSKSIEPSSYRSFSVSGEGKVVAVPDVAQFSFSVITEGGKNIGDIQQENTQKANRAIALLKDSGIEDKDIKTASYSLQPRYQYFSCPVSKNSSAKPCPPPEIVGYTISQTVSVKIRDFEKIGEILSGVVQSGVNSVSELSFTIDDRTEIENQARQEAIAVAISKAESIAQAGNFNLGKILSINENSFPVFNQYKTLGIGGSEDFAVSAPVIEPGSQEVSIGVTISYEIR